MMASSLILNPVASNSERSRDSSRKKKKKKAAAAREDDRQDQDHTIKWKSQAQHQVYSSKLLRALSQVRISSPTNETPRRGRAVREAADTVLAMTAKGRSRWSRAILTNRLKIKFRKHNRQKAAVAARVTGNSRTKKPRVSVLRLRGKGLPIVQRKVRLLGRLVPGCRKQPLPVILDEVPDYIAALEMQIRVMSAIVNFDSSSSSGIDSSIFSSSIRS